MTRHADIQKVTYRIRRLSDMHWVCAEAEDPHSEYPWRQVRHSCDSTNAVEFNSFQEAYGLIFARKYYKEFEVCPALKLSPETHRVMEVKIVETIHAIGTDATVRTVPGDSILRDNYYSDRDDWPYLLAVSRGATIVAGIYLFGDRFFRTDGIRLADDPREVVPKYDHYRLSPATLWHTKP